MVQQGTCALGAVQLVVSWRMLTTFYVVLRRSGVSDRDARLACDALAGAAAHGPSATPPLLLLGGTGLLPMVDNEDASVAEVAFIGAADLLVSYDLGDFEAGPRSRLPTQRLLSDGRGGPGAILVQDALRGDLLAVIPDLAIGWLRGQVAPPTLLRTSNTTA